MSHLASTPLLVPGAVHEDDGSLLMVYGHTWCSDCQETNPPLPGVEVEHLGKPLKWFCLPPFPVLCLDTIRCCTARLCYTCFVPMRPAAKRKLFTSFPAQALRREDARKG